MSPQDDHMTDEVLTDLAMGLTAGGRASKIVAHINRCSACEERFRNVAAEWEHAAVRVDEILSQVPTADQARASTPSAWDRYVQPNIKWAAIAATLIVVAMIVPYLVPGSDEGPALGKLPPLTQDIMPRSVISGDHNEILMKGLDAYANDDLDATIDALEAVETEGAIDALRRVYLASALAGKARYQDALDILAPVPFELVPDPWSSEAQWTQYVAFERSGRKEEARAALQRLADQPGEAGDRARAIIDPQP